MNMKYIPVVLGIVGFLTSCSTLKSEFYPGEQLDITECDIAPETIWKFNDAVYYIHKVGSNDFVAATMTWNERMEDYELDSFPIIFSALEDDHFFLSKRGRDNLYSILRAIPADDTTWVLHFIDPDTIRQHMDEGKVNAEEEQKSFTLTGSKAEQDDYLLKNMDAVFPISNIAIAEMIHEGKKPKHVCPENTEPVKAEAKE